MVMMDAGAEILIFCVFYLQISSRLQSIEEADALLLLPMYAEAKPKAMKGAILDAYILKPFFISSYE